MPPVDCHSCALRRQTRGGVAVDQDSMYMTLWDVTVRSYRAFLSLCSWRFLEKASPTDMIGRCHLPDCQTTSAEIDAFPATRVSKATVQSSLNALCMADLLLWLCIQTRAKTLEPYTESEWMHWIETQAHSAEYVNCNLPRIRYYRYRRPRKYPSGSLSCIMSPVQDTNNATF